MTVGSLTDGLRRFLRHQGSAQVLQSAARLKFCFSGQYYSSPCLQATKPPTVPSSQPNEEDMMMGELEDQDEDERSAGDKAVCRLFRLSSSNNH